LQQARSGRRHGRVVALRQTPPVKTFVVGLGATRLDEIASLDRAERVHYFPISVNVATQLPAALASIAGRATCDYNNRGQTVMIDPNLLNVVSVSARRDAVIGYVTSSIRMRFRRGWY